MCIAVYDLVNDHNGSFNLDYFISDQLVTFPASICVGIGELDIKRSLQDLMLINLLWKWTVWLKRTY